MPPKPRRRKPTQRVGPPNRPATTSQAEAPPPAPQAEAPPPTSQAEADLDQRCMDEGGPAEAIMAWYSAHEPEKADVGHVAKVIRMFKKRAQKLKVGGDVAPDWRKMMYAAFYENNQVNPCHLIRDIPPVEHFKATLEKMGIKPEKAAEYAENMVGQQCKHELFNSATEKELRDYFGFTEDDIGHVSRFRDTVDIGAQGGGFRRKKIKSKKMKKGKSKKMKKRKSRRTKKRKSRKTKKKNSKRR